MSTAAKVEEVWIGLKCECGRGKGWYGRHYSVCRCACGLFYWALQPKRGGPLVAYPWPGNNVNREAA